MFRGEVVALANLQTALLLSLGKRCLNQIQFCCNAGGKMDTVETIKCVAMDHAVQIATEHIP